ncbi:MAG: response regulator [Armatimonadota bacterium]|nr:response regulator [Armatimonadota bacterium]
MGTTLRILIADDSEDDVLMILRELRRSGYDPVHEHVDNAEAFKAALRVPTWDVILCDYVMPQLSVEEALRLRQEKNLGVPFIVISGVFGEYIAARTIAAGAHDYIVKGDLGRLVRVIREALREAELRRSEREGKDRKESATRSKGASRRH